MCKFWGVFEHFWASYTHFWANLRVFAYLAQNHPKNFFSCFLSSNLNSASPNTPVCRISIFSEHFSFFAHLAQISPKNPNLRILRIWSDLAEIWNVGTSRHPEWSPIIKISNFWIFDQFWAIWKFRDIFWLNRAKFAILSTLKKSCKFFWRVRIPFPQKRVYGEYQVKIQHTWGFI